MHLGAWCNGIALAVVAGLPSGFHDWAQAIDTALRTSLAITACRSLLSPVIFDEVQSHYTLIIVCPTGLTKTSKRPSMLQDGGGRRKYTEYLLDLPPY
jgi:hypothetical protein